MAGPASLQQAARDVGAVASQVEHSFLEIGGRLSTAIEATDRILPLFGALHHTLQAPEMNWAVDALHGVAEQLSALVADTGRNGSLLDNLLHLAERLSNRISRMRMALRGVDVLAINAKIAASHVRDQDQSMESFADEIEKALKLFQGNLELVAGKLNSVIADLRRVRQQQQHLLKQRNEAARRVAESLHETLGRVDERRLRAVSAALSVQEKAAEVSREIGNAIMALQIGDATRQRLEHVVSGLIACHEFQATHGMVADQEMAVLEATVRQLQTLNLQATAEEYEKNTALIQAGLIQLAEATGAIIISGQEAYSRGAYGDGSFLMGLRDEVVAVKDLLISVQVAEREAEQMVGRTLQSIDSLDRYVRAIQLLETDIRVLALNTTLKCSRLGQAGLSLAVIAQELRNCSVTIAADAGNALEDLRELVAAGSMGAQAATERTQTPVDDLIERTEASAQTLYNGGLQLSKSLDALAKDGRLVSAIVDEAVALIGQQLTVAQTIRGYANQLHAPAQDSLAVTALVGKHEAFFMGLRRSYTMEQERAVFDTFLGEAVHETGQQDRTESFQAETAPADLDDFLF